MNSELPWGGMKDRLHPSILDTLFTVVTRLCISYWGIFLFFLLLLSFSSPPFSSSSFFLSFFLFSSPSFLLLSILLFLLLLIFLLLLLIFSSFFSSSLLSSSSSSSLLLLLLLLLLLSLLLLLLLSSSSSSLSSFLSSSSPPFCLLLLLLNALHLHELVFYLTIHVPSRSSFLKDFVSNFKSCTGLSKYSHHSSIFVYNIFQYLCVLLHLHQDIGYTESKFPQAWILIMCGPILLLLDWQNGNVQVDIFMKDQNCWLLFKFFVEHKSPALFKIETYIKAVIGM